MVVYLTTAAMCTFGSRNFFLPIHGINDGYIVPITFHESHIFFVWGMNYATVAFLLIFFCKFEL